MNNYLVPLVILLALTASIALVWAVRSRPRAAAYRAVLDNLKDAILVFDQNGQVIYVNQTARSWFGHDEPEPLDVHSVQARISPAAALSNLLARDGQAILEIGSRSVKAISQRVVVQGHTQTTLVLRDATASQALLAKERRRVYELAVFNEINQTINASLNLGELLDSILSKLEQLFPYTSAVISLWDPKAERLVTRGCVGPMARPHEVQALDAGYIAGIVQEHKPLLVSDTSRQPDPGLAPDVRSYVGIPLLTGAQLIGTLELTSDQAGTFSTETLDTLSLFSGQAAVAIENARLYSETLLRTDELATLYTLSAAVSASLNLGELLEIVVYATREAIGCDRVAIFIMDNDRGVLNLSKARGLSGDYIRHSQNLKPQPQGQAQVVLDRYPLVVSDIRQAQVLGRLEPWVEKEGFVAFADFPLRGREHVLGALTVYYDQPHAFGENELELLKTFANQVTLALENARLYERTDRALARRVDQLAAVEEIGRELTATLDLTRVFNLVLERAMGSTGASAGVLALSKPEQDDLELIAQRGYPASALRPYQDGGLLSNEGIVGRVARTGEPALVNDVQADPDYVPHLKTTSAQLAVPILKEARVLGVVSLESSRPQGFSTDDARFTAQLAELAAIAIDNARLFQEVRQGRDNLQAILDSTHGGILVVDREVRIVLANPMIEELSGLAAHQLVGRQLRGVVAELGPRATAFLGHPDAEAEQALALLETMSDAVSKRTYELPGPTARHIEQMTAPVIDKDGAVVGRLLLLRDVTEEHRLTQMRQDLTDMIIHDLRSPLTAVVGGIQVAGDALKTSAEPAMIQHALDMANEACERVIALIDSLLDISRLEAGQMPLNRQPVSLTEMAQSVIQQVRPLTERDRVTLQLQALSHVPTVKADHELINRVLVNLVDNALKYSPSNGVVTIKIVPEFAEGDRRWPDAERDPAPTNEPPLQAVRCTVLDMGPGIPAGNRETIFERFAQLGGRRRGAGLGLAFCRLAVQAHGGRIWVEDNPRGQGSAFSFSLPLVSSQLLSHAGLDSTDSR